MLSSARPSSDALSSVGRLKPTFSESRRAGRTRPGAFGTVFGEARSSGASALRLGALWAMCCKVGLGESTFNVGSCRPEPQADRSESLRSTGRGGRRVGVRHLRLTRPTVARLPFHFGDGAILSSCCRFLPKHSKATLGHSKAFYILTGVEQSLGLGVSDVRAMPAGHSCLRFTFCNKRFLHLHLIMLMMLILMQIHPGATKHDWRG